MLPEQVTMISQLKDGVRFKLHRSEDIYIRQSYPDQRVQLQRMYYIKENIDNLHYYLDKAVKEIIPY